MSNIDWSKAPEGAEYARKTTTGVDWYKRDSLGALVYMAKNGEWTLAGWTSEADCERRPTWNGEGLPPVGTVCEWKERTGFSWVKATVLFITDSSVVMQREDGFEWQMMTARTVFRPFRTPEQISKEVRSKACDKMYGVILDRIPPERRNNGSDICEALYDEGYRKIESLTAE